MNKQVYKGTGELSSTLVFMPLLSSLGSPLQLLAVMMQKLSDLSGKKPPSSVSPVGAIHLEHFTSQMSCLIALSPSAKCSNFLSFQTSSLGSVSPENGWQITLEGFRSILQLQSSFLTRLGQKSICNHEEPLFPD